MEWLKLIHGTPQDAAQEFGPGDEIRVWYRIQEQGKERLGQFEGTVIRCRGSGPSRTFTVRRVTYGEGVERVFPKDAKMIARIEVLRQGKVKRSRLYFLRRVIGKTRIASGGDVGGAQGASPAGTLQNAAPSARRTEGEATAAQAQPADTASPRT